MTVWVWVIVVTTAGVCSASSECGGRKANYFSDIWGNIFVHYTYEFLSCTHGCCGSVNDRHCCSPVENHAGTVVGGVIGGVFAFFLMVAISLFLCKYYNMKKNRTNPEDNSNDIGTVSYRGVRYNHRKNTVLVPYHQNEPPPAYRPSTSGTSTTPSGTELPPPYNNSAERY